MKKNYISALIFGLGVALLASCTPEPISEEQVFLTEDAVSQLVSADNGKIFTLNELLDTYMTEEGNYKSETTLYRTRANNGDGTWLFSLDTLPSAGEGIYIRGRVTTDDYGGNFYKAMCIQQVVNGQQQALRISVDGSSVSGMYPLGQEILIRCNGLAIGRYADQPQLCMPSYNNNYTANSANQKVGWAPGRIQWDVFQDVVKRIGRPDLSKLKVDTISITDFQNITAEREMRYWDGKLVCIKNVWFTGQYENNGSFSNCTTGNPEEDSNANVYAPTTNNIGFPQSRVITDGTNKTLVSNSEYAKHAYYYLPGANASGVTNCPQWKGNVTGILGQYRDNAKYAHDKYDWSISIRDLRDLDLKNTAGDSYYPDFAMEYGETTGL